VIKALIAWGIGFGGPQYLPTHGLTPGALPESPHNVFRLGPDGTADVFRLGPDGTADVFRAGPSGTGKVFR
jgi:hypothetical protein